MSDLDRRLREYWDEIVESHPTPTAEEVWESSETLLARPPRRTRLLVARPWLAGVAGFVGVLILAGVIYALTGSEEELQQPASPPPPTVEPVPSHPIIEVVLPEGTLNGDHFPEGAAGFQYLIGGDPDNEANWHDWPGQSTKEGEIRMEGVLQGVAPGDWVGLRHTGEGDQAVTQIIAFTFDGWDLTTASGTIDPTAEGVVMVGWWDPIDPDNINGNGENEIVDGTWQVTDLHATEGSTAFAYWQDSEGNNQAISHR